MFAVSRRGVVIAVERHGRHRLEKLAKGTALSEEREKSANELRVVDENERRIAREKFGGYESLDYFHDIPLLQFL